MTWAKVWLREDHPNLKKLPVDAPEKVKFLYKSDGQLASLRISSYPDNVVARALTAWEAYRMAKTKANQYQIERPCRTHSDARTDHVPKLGNPFVFKD